MNNTGRREEKKIRILNIGSLNIDYFYGVERFAEEGATIKADSFNQSCGGKGLNQSVAIAKAGADIWQAGILGKDGMVLRQCLEEVGVHTEFLVDGDAPSGHAIIQLDRDGKNCIIVYKGSNDCIEKGYVDTVLSSFSRGDFVLLQNETSNVEYMIQKAHELGMVVFFNPSPITEGINEYPIELVDYLILNEIEGKYLSREEDYREILLTLKKKYPQTTTILTVGKDGALCLDAGQLFSCGTLDVPVVDTTGAGDTFCGYFAALLSQHRPIRSALVEASIASSLCVMRMGTANSIPSIEDVMAFCSNNRSETDQIIAVIPVE